MINIPETEIGRVLRELNQLNIRSKTIPLELQVSALNCNFKLFLIAPFPATHESLYKK